MRPIKAFRATVGFLAIALVLGSAVGGAETTQTVSNAAVNDTLVYVGTYTGEKSKGIYLFRLQTQNLEVSQNIMLVPLGLAAVSAFSIDPATGKLTLLNQRPSMGTGPCHLVLDKEGRNLLVANYGSGSVAVLPVQPDGRLGEATAFVQHTGKSVNPGRQKGPHAHCVTLDPAHQFVFVCDLGLDKIMIYRFDAQQGKLSPHEPAFAQLKAGAGPRHMVVRPDGRFAYVINELNST